MYGVDLYGRVRLAVLGQGISQQEAARRFGMDRGTVSKMVAHSVPSGYRRPVAPRRPKLDAHSGFIDQIRHDDIGAPKKQRHTIQRIYDRLREDRGFGGGYENIRSARHCPAGFSKILFNRAPRRTPAAWIRLVITSLNRSS